MRLRPDGFLATRHTARTLRRCRELLGQPSEPLPRRAQSVLLWIHEARHMGAAEELLWRCQSLTRHEPAGLPKAAVADTITGSSEPPGGRASLWGSEAPNMWSPGPASPSRGGASGV